MYVTLHFGASRSSPSSPFLRRSLVCRAFFIPDTNPTWWDVNSTTVKHYLNQGLQLRDFCALNATAQPLWESYGPNSGVVSEPHSPLIQSRIDLLIYNMTQTVGFDAVFEDQVAFRWPPRSRGSTAGHSE